MLFSIQCEVFSSWYTKLIARKKKLSQSVFIQELLRHSKDTKPPKQPSFLLCRFYCTLFPAFSSNRQWNFEILLAVCIVNCTKNHMITHHSYMVRGVILVKLDTPVDARLNRIFDLPDIISLLMELCPKFNFQYINNYVLCLVSSVYENNLWQDIQLSSLDVIGGWQKASYTFRGSVLLPKKFQRNILHPCVVVSLKHSIPSYFIFFFISTYYY